MTFRARLTAFFLLLVVVPIAVLGVLVTQLSSQSSTGKADARLATALETAIAAHRQDLRQARRAARRVAADQGLVDALRADRTNRAGREARRLASELDPRTGRAPRRPAGFVRRRAGDRPGRGFPSAATEPGWASCAPRRSPHAPSPGALPG